MKRRIKYISLAILMIISISSGKSYGNNNSSDKFFSKSVIKKSTDALHAPACEVPVPEVTIHFNRSARSTFQKKNNFSFCNLYFFTNLFDHYSRECVLEKKAIDLSSVRHIVPVLRI